MKRTPVICAALFALSTPAFPQAQQVTPNYRVVEHGRTIKLSGYGSFDANCKPLGRATINLVSAPHGGQVETQAGNEFPTFSTNNVRWKCDRIRGPETVLYYKASGEFTGPDEFTIEIVFADGEARQDHWTVNVR